MLGGDWGRELWQGYLVMNAVSKDPAQPLDLLAAQSEAPDQ